MISTASLLCLAAACIAAVGGARAASQPADCECKYLAQIPTTRVDLSAKDERSWVSFTKTLANEVQAADQGKAWDVVFYGDSITEDYRGTSIGLPIARADGSPAVFQKYFSSKYSTGIMAVAGDQTDNLLYRLQNGETPKKAPKVAVVLIGTNDFGAVDMCYGSGTDLLETVPGASRRYGDLVSYMRYTMQTTHIILVAILPRAGWTLSDISAYPNRFSAPISKVNEYIEGLASKDPMLHYIDCNAGFVNSTDVIPSLMPDGLHPNNVGMEMLAQCYGPLIAQLVTTPPTANATQAKVPLLPLSPCKSSDAGVEGATAGADTSAAPLSPDTSTAAPVSTPASATTPVPTLAPVPTPATPVPTPAAVASPPPGDIFAGLRDLFSGGQRTATLSHVDAMAARTASIIANAPDPDCLLC